MHNERCTSGSEGGLEKPGGRKADRALRSDPTLNRPETARAGPIVAGFVCLFLTGAGVCPARADETPASPEAQARGLAAEVLRKAGDGDLGEWTRDVIERALGRAGAAAGQTEPGRSGETPPLPAERHAGDLSGPRSGTADVLVFTSLSVPAASWRQWAREAARSGAPLLLRGVGEGGLPGIAKQIGERLDGAEAGVAIDPRLFRLFGIERVPAVVVVPGGVPPCRSRGCADDPAPPHDRVTGNIGLAAALEAVADEGSVARDAARVHLRRLEGGDRP